MGSNRRSKSKVRLESVRDLVHLSQKIEGLELEARSSNNTLSKAKFEKLQDLRKTVEAINLDITRNGLNVLDINREVRMVRKQSIDENNDELRRVENYRSGGVGMIGIGSSRKQWND